MTEEARREAVNRKRAEIESLTKVIESRAWNPEMYAVLTGHRELKKQTLAIWSARRAGR